MYQKQSNSDGSNREASNIAWSILKQVERIGEYKHNMFLNSSGVKEGMFAQQTSGYAVLLNDLEILMWPLLSGDEDYEYEVNDAGVDELKYPSSNDPQYCYKIIRDYDKKYKIMAKRFWRFGLMPVLPTSLNMITRTQKYDKFKQRIRAQAIKYLDLFGEDLVDHIKEKRGKKDAQELREADYSRIYRDYLKSTKIDYDDMEEDVLAYIEEN